MELLTSTGKGALHTEKPSAHVLFFYCACAILLLRMCYSSTARVLFFYCACAYSTARVLFFYCACAILLLRMCIFFYWVQFRSPSVRLGVWRRSVALLSL